MAIQEILTFIDAKIAELQQARKLLEAAPSAPTTKLVKKSHHKARSPRAVVAKKKVGRPKLEAIAPRPPALRRFTPEGLRRLSEAAKARWAKTKKARKGASKLGAVSA